jgi:hypothetical protein
MHFDIDLSKQKSYLENEEYPNKADTYGSSVTAETKIYRTYHVVDYEEDKTHMKISDNRVDKVKKKENVKIYRTLTLKKRIYYD